MPTSAHGGILHAILRTIAAARALISDISLPDHGRVAILCGPREESRARASLLCCAARNTSALILTRGMAV